MRYGDSHADGADGEALSDGADGEALSGRADGEALADRRDGGTAAGGTGDASADRRLLAALRDCGDRPAVAAAARSLSYAGEHAALWLAAGLTGAAADPARRSAWLRATAAVAGAHLTSMAVKRVVRRPRPPDGGGRAALVRTVGRHSFPSSHAASAAAAAVAFGALLPRGGGRRLLPAAVAAAMCVSRVVVGVHYPTDVLAGALLGGLTARVPTVTRPRTAGRRNGRPV
ncbi:phosphatase PAP2 family protein [Streptomyces tsukubensis]